MRQDDHQGLWKVNGLNGYARHATRALVRGTIAFAKTSAALPNRMWLFLAARNHTQGIRERTAARRRTAPAMLLGLEPAPATGGRHPPRRPPPHPALRRVWSTSQGQPSGEASWTR